MTGGLNSNWQSIKLAYSPRRHWLSLKKIPDLTDTTEVLRPIFAMEEAFFTEKTLLLLNETQHLFDGHQRLVHTLRITLKKTVSFTIK